MAVLPHDQNSAKVLDVARGGLIFISARRAQATGSPQTQRKAERHVYSSCAEVEPIL